MTVQLYDYEVGFDWNKTIESGNYFLGSIPNIDDNGVKNEIAGILYAEAEKAFIEKVVSTGHYFEFGGVTTTVNTYERKLILMSSYPQQIYRIRVTMTGTTKLTFKTDVADYTAHNSPQLLAAISLMIIAIAGAITAHAGLILGIFLVIAFAIGVWQIANLTTNVRDFFKENPFGATLTIVVVLIIAVLIFVAFMGRGKKP